MMAQCRFATELIALWIIFLRFICIKYFSNATLPARPPVSTISTSFSQLPNKALTNCCATQKVFRYPWNILSTAALFCFASIRILFWSLPLVEWHFHQLILLAGSDSVRQCCGLDFLVGCLRSIDYEATPIPLSGHFDENASTACWVSQMGLHNRSFWYTVEIVNLTWVLWKAPSFGTFSCIWWT